MCLYMCFIPDFIDRFLDVTCFKSLNSKRFEGKLLVTWLLCQP